MKGAVRLNKIYRLHCGLILILSLFFLSCSSGSAPQTGATPTVTQHVATAQLVYTADWSKGLDEWKPSKGWKVVKNYLETQVLPDLSITLPYTPKTPDYAIEFRLQVVSVPANGGHYRLAAAKDGEKDGYTAEVLGLLAGDSHTYAVHPLMETLIEPQENMGSAQPQVFDFEPGDEWRTYRVEVRGPRVEFLVNERRMSGATSIQSKQLSQKQITLECSRIVARVSDFRVYEYK